MSNLMEMTVNQGRKILLMSPKWSEGVLTAESWATLEKCSSS